MRQHSMLQSKLWCLLKFDCSRICRYELYNFVAGGKEKKEERIHLKEMGDGNMPNEWMTFLKKHLEWGWRIYCNAQRI